MASQHLFLLIPRESTGSYAMSVLKRFILNLLRLTNDDCVEEGMEPALAETLSCTSLVSTSRGTVDSRVARNHRSYPDADEEGG